MGPDRVLGIRSSLPRLDVFIPQKIDARDVARLDNEELRAGADPFDVLGYALGHGQHAHRDLRQALGVLRAQRDGVAVGLGGLGLDRAPACRRPVYPVLLAAEDGALKFQGFRAEYQFVGGDDARGDGLAQSPIRIDHDLSRQAVQGIAGEQHARAFCRDHLLDDDGDVCVAHGQAQPVAIVGAARCPERGPAALDGIDHIVGAAYVQVTVV